MLLLRLVHPLHDLLESQIIDIVIQTLKLLVESGREEKERMGFVIVRFWLHFFSPSRESQIRPFFPHLALTTSLRQPNISRDNREELPGREGKLHNEQNGKQNYKCTAFAYFQRVHKSKMAREEGQNKCVG